MTVACFRCPPVSTHLIQTSAKVWSWHAGQGAPEDQYWTNWMDVVHRNACTACMAASFSWVNICVCGQGWQILLSVHVCLSAHLVMATERYWVKIFRLVGFIFEFNGYGSLIMILYQFNKKTIEPYWIWTHSAFLLNLQTSHSLLFAFCQLFFPFLCFLLSFCSLPL